jgi:hypothetical protein
VQVHHFFELWSRILEEPIRYENEDSEYYDLVVQESLEKATSGQCPIGPFDAVLIDEGQDFSEEMLKTVISLLAPGGDLVIALDSYQDLYRRAGSWKSLGVNANGRTTHLRKVYRNTVEIFEFTQRFIGETPKSENQLALLPESFIRTLFPGIINGVLNHLGYPLSMSWICVNPIVIGVPDGFLPLRLRK